MYVTVRRYDGVDIEQLQQRSDTPARDGGLVGLISTYPGFMGYYMVDLGDGGLMTISIFMDQVEAEMSNETAVEWAKEHMQGILPNPPETTGGYVLRHANPQS